jgi:hypothetical protein
MFRKCSTCKTEIEFGASYYLCSVSTCNRNRTGLFFCSVACWDAHLPMMRHREAWAVEERAPSREAWQKEQEAEAMVKAADQDPERTGIKRRIVGAEENDDVPKEILIVVSKLKAYVKARSGMNTSDSVIEVLSDRVRALCNEAIRSAARDDRKTILDRDFT